MSADEKPGLYERPMCSPEEYARIVRDKVGQLAAIPESEGGLTEPLRRMAKAVDEIERIITEATTMEDPIEYEIQAKGKTAARVTPVMIEKAIASEHYFTAAQGDQRAQEDAAFAGGGLHGAGRESPAALGLLTICVLVLRNGFTVVGTSACASPANFDAELGRKIAYKHAVDQVWPLEGYLLKQRLHEAE